MKNITLSADESVIARAREAARRRGTSLNHLVREFLAELGEGSSVDAESERLRELSLQADGHRRGWIFDREELHERS